MKRALIALALVLTIALAPTATAATVAKASTTKTTVGANEEVVFSASASTPEAGRRLVSYQWDFGDGNTGSGVRAAHKYTTNGRYEVTLVVIDNTGARATDNLTVNVLAAAGPDATHTPVTSAKEGEALKLTGSAGSTNAARRVQVAYQTVTGFETIAANVTGGSWTATIPADAVKPGLAYYVTATDAEGRTLRLPAKETYAVEVTPKTAAATTTTTPASPQNTPAVEAEKGAPGAALPLVLVALAAVALARRR